MTTDFSINPKTGKGNGPSGTGAWDRWRTARNKALEKGFLPSKRAIRALLLPVGPSAGEPVLVTDSPEETP